MTERHFRRGGNHTSSRRLTGGLAFHLAGFATMSGGAIGTSTLAVQSRPQTHIFLAQKLVDSFQAVPSFRERLGRERGSRPFAGPASLRLCGPEQAPWALYRGLRPAENGWSVHIGAGKRTLE